MDKYITWVRLGDEYMKILKVKIQRNKQAELEVQLTVLRGLWNSPQLEHPTSTAVLSPIYHANGAYPDGSSGGIRYALDPAS